MLSRLASLLKKAIPYVPIIFFAYIRAAFAQPPDFVQGALRLLTDATTWLLGLIPAASGAAIGYHALMKQLGDSDPAAAAAHNKAMRNILVGGAIGTSAVGITRAFLSYFQ